jgi:hypothetical protein
MKSIEDKDYQKEFEKILKDKEIKEIEKLDRLIELTYNLNNDKKSTT